MFEKKSSSVSRINPNIEEEVQMLTLKHNQLHDQYIELEYDREALEVEIDNISNNVNYNQRNLETASNMLAEYIEKYNNHLALYPFTLIPNHPDSQHADKLRRIKISVDHISQYIIPAKEQSLRKSVLKYGKTHSDLERAISQRYMVLNEMLEIKKNLYDLTGRQQYNVALE